MSKTRIFVVLISIMLGLTQTAKGQIYESEACFYTIAGNNRVESIVCFDGSKSLVWIKGDYPKKNLAESKNYYENITWTNTGSKSAKNYASLYEYDYSMSTSQRVVYRYTEKIAINDAYNCFYCRKSYDNPWGNGCGAHGYRDGKTHYVAFSKDKSSYIYWYTNPNDVDKTPRSKTTYTRVPKEDLLPKAANDDFLNE